MLVLAMAPCMLDVLDTFWRDKTVTDTELVQRPILNLGYANLSQCTPRRLALGDDGRCWRVRNYSRNTLV